MATGDEDRHRGSISSHGAPSEHSHPTDKGGKSTEFCDVDFTVGQQPKNYYKAVSENKEIAKLASLLSTSINSNKKVSLLVCVCVCVCVHSPNIQECRQK